MNLRGTKGIRNFIPCIYILLVLTKCYSTVQLGSSIEHEFNKNYDLGRSLKANVGSTLIKIENIYKKPIFSPIIEYQPPGALSGFKKKKLVPEQAWTAVATIPNELGYILENPSFKLRIHINLDGTIGRGWINEFGRAEKAKWTSEPLFERLPEFNIEKGSFSAELIYTGMTGKTIRLTYREYTDDMARPAFFQDLTYELTDSKIIMFRTIKIKVLEATNSYISFIVEDDGGLPWMPKK